MNINYFGLFLSRVRQLSSLGFLRITAANRPITDTAKITKNIFIIKNTISWINLTFFILNFGFLEKIS